MKQLLHKRTGKPVQVLDTIEIEIGSMITAAGWDERTGGIEVWLSSFHIGSAARMAPFPPGHYGCEWRVTSVAA